MSTEPNHAPAPAADLALLEAAADMAVTTYARQGGFQPFGMVETDGGNAVIPAMDLSSPEAKHMFMNILRFVSIDRDGARSAFAFESWTMFSKDPADSDLMREIYANGGSMRDHPKAGEGIYIIVESDDGVTTRINRIVRNGDRITLEPNEDDFEPGEPDGTRGIFTRFHVPTRLRQEAGTAEFARIMRSVVDTEELAMGGDAPTVN